MLVFVLCVCICPTYLFFKLLVDSCWSTITLFIIQVCVCECSWLIIPCVWGCMLQVKLAEVERVEWINRKSYSAIGLLLGRDGRVLLRSPSGLEDWFELLEVSTHLSPLLSISCWFWFPLISNSNSPVYFSPPMGRAWRPFDNASINQQCLAHSLYFLFIAEFILGQTNKCKSQKKINPVAIFNNPILYYYMGPLFLRTLGDKINDKTFFYTFLMTVYKYK